MSQYFVLTLVLNFILAQIYYLFFIRIIGGVLIQLADLLPNKFLVEFLYSTIGGRVIPMTLADENLSPFILLVHHAHTFTPFDPFRAITKLLLPEGFPAHAHAGFDTVTYCIEGGLSHRDSEKFKMSYNDSDVQWMSSGRGVLHEEMWDLKRYQFEHKRIELFQLWVNLPENKKSKYPTTKVISRNDIPIISLGNNNETCKLICGTISNDNQTIINGAGNDLAESLVCILHLNLPNKYSSIVLTPETDHSSILIYIRKGSILITNKNKDNLMIKNEIKIGDYIKYQTKNIKNGCIEIKTGENGVDCLIIAGNSLNEPFVARGPYVQTTQENIYKKAQILSNSEIQTSWDYKLNDQDWLKHCDDLNLQELL